MSAASASAAPAESTLEGVPEDREWTLAGDMALSGVPVLLIVRSPWPSTTGGGEAWLLMLLGWEGRAGTGGGGFLEEVGNTEMSSVNRLNVTQQKTYTTKQCLCIRGNLL